MSIDDQHLDDQHLEEQHAAKEAVLDLFAAATGIPITLYEFPDGPDGDPTFYFTEEAIACSASHCQLIQGYDDGAACRQDQIKRARKVYTTGEPILAAPCHAGMYNETVPILGNDGKPRAIISYGEVLLVGPEYEEHSQQHHRRTIGKLHLNVIQATQLDEERKKAKRLTREEFESFGNVVNKTIRLLYGLIDQDEQMRRKTDHLSHEIQTPIQLVLGRIDNLLTLWPAESMDETQREKAKLPVVTRSDLYERLQGVWHAAVHLRTVAQTLTLGTFLTDYRFEEHSLLLMLLEAKSNYETEAASRHIDIVLPHDAPTIECSREHLQLALNNLVHNAVKYSFAGSESRRRYIRVEVKLVGEDVELTIANFGIGILPEEMPSKIFEDGYQGKLRHGEYRTGSGKGLHFVKSVVARHHGDIQAKSDFQTDDEPGQGDKAPYLTHVTVRLPRRQPS